MSFNIKSLELKSFFLFVCLSSSAISIMAQNEDSFTADRPGATTGADIVTKHCFQLETGFGFVHNNIGGINENSWTINTSLFRYGLSNNAELRFQIDELIAESDEDGRVSGITNLMVGTKVKLFEGYKVMPKIALLGNLLIPSKNADFLPNHLGCQLHLLFQHDTDSNCGLNYELGSDWVGDNLNPDIFVGACLWVDPIDNFEVFIEEYNTFNKGTQSWIEFGASYMVNSRVQIDISSDLSMNYIRKFGSINLGLSWQITK